MRIIIAIHSLTLLLLTFVVGCILYLQLSNPKDSIYESPEIIMGQDNAPFMKVGYMAGPKYKAGDTFGRKNGETVQITCTESYDSFGHGYNRNCVGRWDKTVKDWVYNTLTVANSGNFLYSAMSEKELDKLKRLEGVHIIGTGERNK